MDEKLDDLVQAVLASAKYRHTSPEFIRTIGQRELAIRPNLKAAIKSTKNVLHQVGGAFIDTPIDYDDALASLRRGAGDPLVLREACRSIMAGHTSSRERLPILDTFFTTILDGIPTPGTVLDIACGLNPLAYSWMPLRPDTRYIAYDIFSDQIDFLNEYFTLAKIAGRAEVRDVVHTPPNETADLALILKTLPCLETVDRQAPARLLDAVQAPRLLVSFPAQSLGGRRKGMVAHYESRFRNMLADRGWAAERFEFATELAFLVEK